MALAVAAAFFFARRLPATTAPAGPFSPLGVFAVSPLDGFALLIVVGGMYVVGPDLCSRVLTARDPAAARRGALLAGAAVLPLAVLIVGTGVALRLSGRTPPNAREALPWLINRAGVVPGWTAALISAGLLAAMLSSADTCLLTAASVLELDLLPAPKRAPDERERRARLWLALIGAASVLLACLRPRIIPNLLLAYAFYTGGLLAPLLLLARPELARRIPRPVVWWAILIGGLVPVLLLLTGTAHGSSRAGLAGTAVCAMILAAGAVAGRRRDGIRAGKNPDTTRRSPS
jgi:SSS family solute:Na+ symporter